MARKATLTISISTNPATAHLGRFFADLRIGNKQATTTGTVKYVHDWILSRKAEADKAGVELIVTDETFKKEFSKSGGMRGV